MTMRPAVTVSAPLTLRDYAADWLQRTRRRVRPQSAYRYEWILDHYILPVLGDVALTELRKAHVIDMVDSVRNRGLSAASARSAHATLSTMLTDAVDRDVLTANVALRLPRSQARMLRGRLRPIGVYDERQLTLFVATAKQATPELAGLFCAMAQAGLRVGEAIGLRPTDIDTRARTILVQRTVRMGGRVGPPKSGHARLVLMPKGLATTLDRYRASEWCFPGRHHGPIGYTKVRHVQAEIARRAGLSDPGPHGLRRSYASILAQRGANAEFLRQQMGHESWAVTTQYARLLPAIAPAWFDDLTSE